MLRQLLKIQADNCELKENKHHFNCFYLFLTSTVFNHISQQQIGTYQSVDEYLKHELEVLNQDIQDQQITELINKQEPDFKDKCLMSILIMSIRIISKCEEQFALSLISEPICYKGHVNGQDMVGLAFECKKKTDLDYGALIRHQKK